MQHTGNTRGDGGGWVSDSLGYMTHHGVEYLVVRMDTARERGLGDLVDAAEQDRDLYNSVIDAAAEARR